MSATETPYMAKWQRIVAGLRYEGLKSYAIVAVDEAGEVYWGSHFGHQPESLLRRLRTIEQDIKQHIARQEKVAREAEELRGLANKALPASTLVGVVDAIHEEGGDAIVSNRPGPQATSTGARAGASTRAGAGAGAN